MYTLKQIMDMLSIPERTIRRHLKLGILTGTKVGGVWKFTDEDLKAYLSSDKIVKSQTLTRINEILDYINGFSEYDDQVLLVKQFPRTTIADNAHLSSILNQLCKPFYFNLDRVANKTVITLRGNEEEMFDVLKEFNNYLNKKA